MHSGCLYHIRRSLAQSGVRGTHQVRITLSSKSFTRLVRGPRRSCCTWNQGAQHHHHQVPRWRGIDLVFGGDSIGRMGIVSHAFHDSYNLSGGERHRPGVGGGSIGLMGYPP